MKMVRGNLLPLKEQQKALNWFVHRFTKEHIPRWAKQEEWKDGKPYPVQFASDMDWLEHTDFYVTNSGRLSELHTHCMGRPTWPDNPELRRKL